MDWRLIERKYKYFNFKITSISGQKLHICLSHEVAEMHWGAVLLTCTWLGQGPAVGWVQVAPVFLLLWSSRHQIMFSLC